MKGIRIRNGATFVQYEGVTVRILQDGTCALSPVLYESLEWELRTEEPDSWDYVGEYDVRAMGNGVYEKVLEIVRRTRGILNG